MEHWATALHLSFSQDHLCLTAASPFEAPSAFRARPGRRVSLRSGPNDAEEQLGDDYDMPVIVKAGKGSSPTGGRIECGGLLCTMVGLVRHCAHGNLD